MYPRVLFIPSSLYHILYSHFTLIFEKSVILLDFFLFWERKSFYFLAMFVGVKTPTCVISSRVGGSANARLQYKKSRLKDNKTM